MIRITDKTTNSFPALAKMSDMCPVGYMPKQKGPVVIMWWPSEQDDHVQWCSVNSLSREQNSVSKRGV